MWMRSNEILAGDASMLRGSSSQVSVHCNAAIHDSLFSEPRKIRLGDLCEDHFQSHMRGSRAVALALAWCVCPRLPARSRMPSLALRRHRGDRTDDESLDEAAIRAIQIVNGRRGGRREERMLIQL